VVLIINMNSRSLFLLEIQKVYIYIFAKLTSEVAFQKLIFLLRTEQVRNPIQKQI